MLGTAQFGLVVISSIFVPFQNIRFKLELSRTSLDFYTGNGQLPDLSPKERQFLCIFHHLNPSYPGFYECMFTLGGSYVPAAWKAAKCLKVPNEF